jgi:DNA-binding CsgD family transcriptional regulator
MSARLTRSHGHDMSLMDDIVRIATGPGDAVSRAEALMERLRTVFPFDASFIALFRPGHREHSALLRAGYDARACAYLDSTAFADDLELLGLQARRPPLRVCDYPVPPGDVPAWVDHFASAGFREGVKVGLFTPDGRYLGVIGMHTESAVPATEDALDLLDVLTPLIAHAVDPWRSAAAAAQVVSDAVAGTVLTACGTAVPLPGLPGHPLLSTGSAVLRAAAQQLIGGAAVASFLCPLAATRGADSHVRVTAIPAAPPPPEHHAAVVTVSPPGDLHGLTRRELEVLGLLVEGWPNHAIALGLAVTERTVAAHVEHILTKLTVPTRTAAAATALRAGLYVPRLLHGGALSGEHPAQ